MCKKGFVMYHATGKLRHKRAGKKKKIGFQARIFFCPVYKDRNIV